MLSLFFLHSINRTSKEQSMLARAKKLILKILRNTTGNGCRKGFLLLLSWLCATLLSGTTSTYFDWLQKEWAFCTNWSHCKNPPYWMVKKCGILHWDIEKKGKSSLTEVGIPLCSNLLHSFVIQYGGFCTM